MPELPEVINVSRKLNNKIKGQTIVDVNIVVPKVLKNIDESTFKLNIINRKILDVSNKGKYLLFILDNNYVIVAHLRLEGKFKVYKNDDEFVKGDLASFRLSSSNYLVFYDHRLFATLHLVEKDNMNSVIPLINVGKSPFEISEKELFEKTKNKKLAIKTVLLDQNIISGLGNIYVNEVLWFAKINPCLPANKINEKQINEILNYSKIVLDKATEMGGSTISSFESLDGEEGTYQTMLEVHMKKGQKCSRCQSLIEKIQVNGRGTYFCPICQK